MKIPTREQLVKRRGVTIADAQMKLEVGDWHGCADACMDLREIDAQITLFDQLRETYGVHGGSPLAVGARQTGKSITTSGWGTEDDLDLEGAALPDGAHVGKRVL